MAYVTPQDDEQDAVALDAPVKIATQAPGAVGSSTPADGVVQDATSKPASSGTFTNLKSYLNANQTGAQEVGGRVAGKIGSEVSNANASLDTNANAFRDKVSQNTYSNDPGMLSGVAAKPTDYLDNATLQRNLTGSYAGPTSFTGSQEESNAIADKQKAEQTANLANTAGGRTELINQTAAKPLSRGGANLDQWLVQGNQPSISNVLNAAATANPLKDRLTGIATAQDTAAKEARQKNINVRDELVKSIEGGQQNYTTGLQNKATAAANDLNKQNDAIRAFLMQAGAGTPTTAAADGTQGLGQMGSAINQAANGIDLNGLMASAPNITVPVGAANSKDYIYKPQQLEVGTALPGAGTLTYQPVAAPGDTSGNMINDGGSNSSAGSGNIGDGDNGGNGGLFGGKPLATPVAAPTGTSSIQQNASQVTPEMLKRLGMDDTTFNRLLAANNLAKSQGLPGADLASFYTAAQSPNFDIGNVADANDIAQMNAYAKLLNQGAPQLNKGAYTQGNFDYLSAAQQIANMIAAKQTGGTVPTGGNTAPVITPTKIGANTTGGYVTNGGGNGGRTIGGNTSGDAVGADGQPAGPSGGPNGYGNIVGVDGYGGFTVGEDGVATPTSSGLTNTQAGAIGTGITTVTGIPGLSVVARVINQIFNSVNENAAAGYNAPGTANGIGNNGGVTTGGAMNVGGDNPTAGENQAAANVGAVDTNAAQAAADADSARAAAAAAAEGERSAAAAAQAQANAQAATQAQAAANQAKAAQQAHDTGLANAKAAGDAAAASVKASMGFVWGKEAYSVNQQAEAARVQAMQAAGFNPDGTTLGGFSFTGNPSVDAAQITHAYDQAHPENTSAGGYTGGGSGGGPSRSGSGAGTANNAGSNSGDGPGCVDPEVPILLSTGHTKPAGELKIGDMLYTMHEHTFKYGDYPVVAMEIIKQPKRLLKFDTGHSMLVSESHKYLMEDKNWKEVRDIQPSESIWSLASTVQIVSIEDAGFGDVVKLTVDDAHTYVADGLISHNKLATGGLVRGPGTGTSDSVKEDLSNGEYVIKASVVKALGKDFLDRLNSLAK